MVVLLAVYGFVLGAVFASFGCVVSERVPRGESINGRSRCACGRQLTLAENVPLLGWLRGRGVARCCGARLPQRYVMAEAALGAAGAIIGALTGAELSSGHPAAAIGGGVAAFALAFTVLLATTWQRPDQ